MKLGKQILRVNKITNNGAYLVNDRDEEIYMPHENDNLKNNQEVEVFVYDNGSKNRVATMKMPYLQVGEVKKGA